MSEDYSKYIEKYRDIFEYIRNYHTQDLIQLLIQKRGDKKEAAKVAAAIAARNSLYAAVGNSPYHTVMHHTDYLIDKAEKRLHDSTLSEQEKRRKITGYCTAIAARNGIHDDLPLIIHIAVKVLKYI